MVKWTRTGKVHRTQSNKRTEHYAEIHPFTNGYTAYHAIIFPPLNKRGVAVWEAHHSNAEYLKHLCEEKLTELKRGE